MFQLITDRRTRIFCLVCLGQLVSLTGSGLTSFALGVWVYQQTGSVTQFALISVSAVVPGILLSPLIGPLIDRIDRRKSMLIGDFGAGLCTLAIAQLFLIDSLSIGYIYALVAGINIFSAIQRPAYTASIVLLVPKENIGHANGMVQISQAIAQIISPAVSGILLTTIGLAGVLMIDIVTFAFSCIMLLLITFPRLPASPDQTPGERSLIREALAGLKYLQERPGLIGLLVLFLIGNLMVGIISILVTPLVLAAASAETLGLVLTIGGVGMLIGSVVMGVWGGPVPRIIGVLGGMFLEGVCIMLGGLQPWVPLFMLAAFGFFFVLPIDAGCSLTIFQSKVEPGVQGRVFAITQTISLASLPVGYFMAGPLADRIFEPLLARDGALAGSVGALIGTGPGRGIGLLFIILGVLFMFSAIVAYLSPRVRLVERELPDVAIDDSVAQQVPSVAV